MEQTAWHTEVLHFWFEELTRKDWFMSTKELDATISNRFGDIHRHLREYPALEEANAATSSAQSCLAAVIVLDQFSRNMYRGSKDAFSSDELALSWTKHAIEHGFDKQLEGMHRTFLYMPFMHSEKIEDQTTSMALMTGDSHKSAVEHFELIKQFGRFPYRNEVLGRKSTEQELLYLKDGKRFGQ